MPPRLDNKVAFITGAGIGGIGAASAAAFAREGARVAVCDILPERGEATVDEIRAIGGEAIFVQADVSKDDEVRAAIGRTVAQFGALHVLMCSAGGSIAEDDFIADVDLSVFEHTMRLDLLGTMLACRHAIPEIAKAGGGSIVNMSSGAALRGASPAHVYTAAKGAIISLTRALAGTYAKEGVRVNAIAAGRILSKRILDSIGAPGQAGPVPDRQDAAGRLKDYPFWVGGPEDIASIALFLASEESKMITGATIPADGGRSAY
ncbi:SDR family oxidoreductase [Roseomonas sp. HJA6]|uniref:SDR family oxidoreductase n=1 Tax=Roseomonas alba TaxID=2846776 RepID=A0ABS7AEG9_9PROT|nr:SDR family oxidoreductase [Neoroseomonas alba]MBW6400455.1 SDR family oxidoreductase [Neoroseomonas alba]